MMNKIKVGILGATGAVGQRFVQLLDNHPYFEVTSLAASDKSSGVLYGDLMNKKGFLYGKIPEYSKNIKVEECIPNIDCRLVFSALDSNVAGQIETDFVDAGYIVSTNSKNHRMDDDVPLLIPEVNPDHLSLIKNKSGYIVANPNCSTIGMVLALAPLHKKYGLTKINVVTMQALSGAGYPGVSSMDIIDNVVPYISGEEEKMQTEPIKILGDLKNGRINYAEIDINAQCNRVHVSDGHLESISFGLKNKISIEEIKQTLSEFNPLKDMNLPSSPEQPIIIRDERPQPKKNRMEGNGMSCVVGGIREDNVLGYNLVVLSHNTIRGAAGGAILNAELLYKKGLIK